MLRLLAPLALLAAATAHAEPYDIRLAKLGAPSSTPTANGDFAIFARTFSAALGSANLAPPTTLGHSGFAVAPALSVVLLETDKPNFRLPTAEPVKGALLVPSLHLRKGLPASFEFGGRVAWVEQSRMVALTGELKWALNEGFTYLPDLGVRASATRLVNSRDFDLTSVGLDVALGKRFALGGVATLAPYAGWNLCWTTAWSNMVDFDRSRTARASLASPTAQLDGTDVFNPVLLNENVHNRFYGGLRLVAGVATFGVEYSHAQLGSVRGPSPEAPTGEDVQRAIPPVAAFNASVGLQY
ncbi:MAG: hypothetical protein RL653_501 [Pseudomonadota bacterium]